jgi:hypothetical protein
VTKELCFIDAIQEGLKQSMQHHSTSCSWARTLPDYGGVSKITEGFVAGTLRSGSACARSASSFARPRHHMVAL